MALKYKEGDRIPVDEHTAGELLLHFSRPIEMLKEDTYEKKMKTSKTGRKIGAGGRHMTFAYDLLKPSDKRKYTKGSPVVSYNMNEVISLNSFNMLEKKKQKELMEYWLNNEIISRGKLAKFWNISNYKFKPIYDGLNIQITNPKLTWRLDNMKKLHSEMTPEKRAESDRKRLETKARKDREEQEKLRKIEYEAKQAEEKEAARQALAEAAALEKKELEVSRADVIEVVQQTTKPIKVQNDLPLSMGFNLANRSGEECLEWSRRVLGFLQGDTSPYKITITLEEVK